MTRAFAYIVVLAGGLAFTLPAPAQDQLDVTMEVVPFADALDPGHVINFPPDATPSQEGQDASRFGRTVAGNAKELGEGFGQSVANEARQMGSEMGAVGQGIAEQAKELSQQGGMPNFPMEVPMGRR